MIKTITTSDDGANIVSKTQPGYVRCQNVIRSVERFEAALDDEDMKAARKQARAAASFAVHAAAAPVMPLTPAQQKALCDNAAKVQALLGPRGNKLVNYVDLQAALEVLARAAADARKAARRSMPGAVHLGKCIVVDGVPTELGAIVEDEEIEEAETVVAPAVDNIHCARWVD